jgi:hypothetical protein
LFRIKGDDLQLHFANRTRNSNCQTVRNARKRNQNRRILPHRTTFSRNTAKAGEKVASAGFFDGPGLTDFLFPSDQSVGCDERARGGASSPFGLPRRRFELRFE